MNRTAEEIRERIKNTDGFLNFEPETLLEYMLFFEAKPLLKEGVKPEDWDSKPRTRFQVIQDMNEYLEFAVGKAVDHRGLSAGRSVDRFRAWMWLLGDDEGVAFSEKEDNYPQYGAPILKFVCERYELTWPEEMSGENFQRMAQGLPCVPDCDEGCSR